MFKTVNMSHIAEAIRQEFNYGHKTNVCKKIYCCKQILNSFDSRLLVPKRGEHTE